MAATFSASSIETATFGLKCGREEDEDEQQTLYRHTTMIQFSP